jgi:hypothetical protein
MIERDGDLNEAEDASLDAGIHIKCIKDPERRLWLKAIQYDVSGMIGYKNSVLGKDAIKDAIDSLQKAVNAVASSEYYYHLALACERRMNQLAEKESKTNEEKSEISMLEHRIRSSCEHAIELDEDRICSIL